MIRAPHFQRGPVYASDSLRREEFLDQFLDPLDAIGVDIEQLEQKRKVDTLIERQQRHRQHLLELLEVERRHEKLIADFELLAAKAREPYRRKHGDGLLLLGARVSGGIQHGRKQLCLGLVDLDVDLDLANKQFALFSCQLRLHVEHIFPIVGRCAVNHLSDDKACILYKFM